MPSVSVICIVFIDDSYRGYGASEGTRFTSSVGANVKLAQVRHWASYSVWEVVRRRCCSPSDSQEP